MKVFEEVEFQVPTSDVQRKDFIRVLKIAGITAAVLIIITIISINIK
ncbi:hypothetical protein SAMN04488524_0606 [Pedobacter africanus]|uniref:Uncharacterized protein n=1 Tax=Pedobacter africanus TaxID=151894 RepID=A0A1W1ZCT6_9SPHI|nr:hypothetical protein SAMN04488524_0606 [Pedobacter africanus]